MSIATYAFVFSGSSDWKLSNPEEWDLTVLELSGNEKRLGHFKIDGAICKILKTEDGKIIALSNQ